MLFAHQIPFSIESALETVEQLPARPAVFVLRGESGEPYLNRTPDLRRRLRRLLLPSAVHSKRLQLAGMVRSIAWAEAASEFSAQWLLYRAALEAFGDRAAQRLHLRTPFFLRMGMRNRFPRLWATNTLSPNALPDLFGPFPSRAAAERYAEQVLDLHLLRRCFQDLEPDPQFPGCIYSEMHKCLAPCFAGCTQQRYDEEASAVHGFLETRGESLLQTLAAERERASDLLDFEAAARTHARHEKVEAVRALAPEIALALSAQRSVVVQPSTQPDAVDLYLFAHGALRGPVPCSVLGMRLPNESSGSSSLFAHPAAFAPVPITAGAAEEIATPEARIAGALKTLQQAALTGTREELCAHQALLARWYFRPQHKRTGELLPAPSADSPANLKALLRAVARVYVAALPKGPAEEQPPSKAAQP